MSFLGHLIIENIRYSGFPLLEIGITHYVLIPGDTLNTPLKDQSPCHQSGPFQLATPLSNIHYLV